MELILISDSKLKIMLNESDMKQYNVNEETDCAEISARKAIRRLLEQARLQTGFNTEGAEIFVQLYTSKSGGCELFVTKSNREDKIYGQGREVERSRKAGDERKKNRTQSSRTAAATEYCRNSYIAYERADEEKSEKGTEIGNIAFSFSSIGDICNVCKRLSSLKISTESLAAADDFGSFYLLLPNFGIAAYTRLGKLTFINEYGERENYAQISTYLGEHGKIICNAGAIETLALY